MAINRVDYNGTTLINLTEDTAVAANVLKNKTFHLKSGESATGSMTNRGAVTATIDEPNGVYTIPKGYHNGSGTVTATYGDYTDFPLYCISRARSIVTPSENSHTLAIPTLDLGDRPIQFAIAFIVYTAGFNQATTTGSSSPYYNTHVIYDRNKNFLYYNEASDRDHVMLALRPYLTSGYSRLNGYAAGTSEYVSIENASSLQTGGAYFYTPNSYFIKNCQYSVFVGG